MILLNRPRKGQRHPPRLLVAAVIVFAVLALIVAFNTNFMDAESGSPRLESSSTTMIKIHEPSTTDNMTKALAASTDLSSHLAVTTVPKVSETIPIAPSTSQAITNSPIPTATTNKPTTANPTTANTTVASTTRSTTASPSTQPVTSQATQPAPVNTTAPRPTVGSSKGMVVVIDPGHQSVPDYETEPLSPGSTIMKAKCSAGTRGVVTRRYEYVVNLEISLKLKALLESQGIQVYLTRSRHDVRVSNIERALFAEGKQADVFIRIHCNGSNDPTVQGVKTYVGESGTYAGKLPQWGQQLSTAVAATTGATNLGVDVSSRYTGLNWADQIPAFLLETGFMSNPDEDLRLSDPTYQDQICRGIADFISLMPDL